MRVTPTENLFLMANTQNNWIFLLLYFRVYFSEGTPSEKYFSDGIRIFLCFRAYRRMRVSSSDHGKECGHFVRASLETQIFLGSQTFFRQSNCHLNNTLNSPWGTFHPWFCLSLLPIFQIRPNRLDISRQSLEFGSLLSQSHCTHNSSSSVRRGLSFHLNAVL